MTDQTPGAEPMIPTMTADTEKLAREAREAADRHWHRTGDHDTARLLDRLAAALDGAPAQGGESEVKRLRGVIERDRTRVADACNAIKKAITAHEWLRLGRGSYEYNDDRWRDEFKDAIEEISEAVKPLGELARDWSDCPTAPAETQAARAPAPAQDAALVEDGAFLNLIHAAYEVQGFLVDLAKNSQPSDPVHSAYSTLASALTDVGPSRLLNGSMVDASGTVAKLLAYANDPMWADHAEVPKALLSRAARDLLAALRTAPSLEPTDAQIKHMVDRFLGWKLPENFSPDGGISFKSMFNENTPHPMRHAPVGTNLLDATQAEAMVRHMIEGMPTAALPAAPSPTPPDVVGLVKRMRRAASAVYLACDEAVARDISDMLTNAANALTGGDGR